MHTVPSLNEQSSVCLWRCDVTPA